MTFCGPPKCRPSRFPSPGEGTQDRKGRLQGRRGAGWGGAGRPLPKWRFTGGSYLSTRNSLSLWRATQRYWVSAISVEVGPPKPPTSFYLARDSPAFSASPHNRIPVIWTLPLAQVPTPSYQPPFFLAAAVVPPFSRGATGGHSLRSLSRSLFHSRLIPILSKRQCLYLSFLFLPTSLPFFPLFFLLQNSRSSTACQATASSKASLLEPVLMA